MYHFLGLHISSSEPTQKQTFFSYAVAPARAGDEEEYAHIPERVVDPHHFTSIPPFLFPSSFS